mmetsp:Transcript_101212/g.179758  ORF Transcript_101212/g.179758 Transcript_101212/m.179758 type:complete len:249 (+) Transcript_101212:30-776(+)|eukprot:CAMPEP_0197652898 /NCGR_PEP_ID=MMETSP1338-20131121/34726_1 /TAXON_ID=43686 ORGANISM="Pelagodinium beii, Strain RCC1491" /NCGR_SAMPLE_ID=MMETSP1338 /ASSEMBLY_ACC=CAM_ASM_000754 /LENGTH=248 /DNA_ID=CAMNT_0043227863 /DNA_START=27 /DNA_END=773 /DNA_ORIENTATION=-
MAEPQQDEESSPGHAALLEFASTAEKAGALPATEIAITEELEGIIRGVAHTGVAKSYPWDALRLLLARKVEHVLSDFWRDAPDLNLREGETFQQSAVEPLTQCVLDPRREGAPWTTQRLCELLAEPRSTYKSTRKYLYALQRAVLIQSTEEALVPCVPASGQAASASSNGVRAEASAPSPAVEEAAQSSTTPTAPATGGAAAGDSVDEAASANEVTPDGEAMTNGAASTPTGRKRKLPEELSNGVVSE